MGSLQQPHATGLCSEPLRYSRSKASCSGPTAGVIAGELQQLQCLHVQLLQGGHGISTDLAPDLLEMRGVC